jgi:flagella basal body P-ring formation protein FlgA
MSRRVSVWLGVLFGLFVLANPAYSSSVSTTDALIRAIRENVVNEYQVAPHDVVIFWNDETLESKLRKFGNTAVVDLQPSVFQRLVAKKTLNLPVIEGGKTRSRILVKVEVDAWAETYSTAQAVRRGEPFSAANLSPVRLKLSQLPDNYVRQSGRIAEDFEAAGNLSAGVVLTQNMLKARPLVLKGGKVKVEVVNGSLILFAQGEALENGVRGQSIRIRIMNFNANTMVKADVTGRDEVKLVVN